MKKKSKLVKRCSPWWRHQMETFSALLALCARNSPVSGEFPAQRPVTRSFDVFFDLHLINKLLGKHSRGWWFETLPCPLWRHRNANKRCCPHRSQWTWAPHQYKDGLSRYGDSHYKDKTVVRPPYPYNGNPYIGKKASLYWDGPLLASNGIYDISNRSAANQVMACRLTGGSHYLNLNYDVTGIR